MRVPKINSNSTRKLTDDFSASSDWVGPPRGGPTFLFWERRTTGGSTVRTLAGDHQTADPMRCLLCAYLLLLTCALPGQSNPFELPLVFTDHAILQRDRPIPLRGKAAPKAKLTVTLGDTRLTAKADKTGHWTVELPARPAGGPYVLTISDGRRTHTIRDILFGDVWLASGQSNMEWTLANADSYAEERNASDARLRQFLVPKAYSPQPQARLQAGSWSVASPETVGQFTAVGYHFAERLRAEIDVPIAILHTSWGGSRIEAWMDASSLGYPDPQTAAAQLEAELARKNAAKRAALLKILPELPSEDEGTRRGEVIWAAPDWPDADWRDTEVPGLWEEQGLPGLDGIVYLRKAFELSDTPTGEARVRLAKVDDHDAVYINGTRVGGIDSYSAERDYTFPANLLNKGRNVITVRVEDTGGGGGVYGAADEVFLEANQRRIPLAGTWKLKVGEVFLGKGIDWDANQQPTLLYNRMIHPLVDFPVRGFLWYQGESNAGGEDAVAYADQFQTLIKLWREKWGDDTLPFYWVQLANFMAPPTDANTASDWAVLRASQSSALALPRTGEAVILDVGEADDIHPRDKRTVGERLAAIALADTYGQTDRVYSGPRLTTATRDGDGVRLTFAHTDSGLQAKADRYGYLRGFALADTDGTYHWARAHIDGDAVIVYHPTIENPTAVRYAWADNPDDANLYNAEGFPAAPFQVDLD